MEDHLQDCR